jgi:hypothetical protein
MGTDRPSVRLPDLTTDWEFGPHTILLGKERKESVGVREEKSAKSAETREKLWGIRGRIVKRVCSDHGK